MLKIGMIGEYPTDVRCIERLLIKKYNNKIDMFPLLYDLHGSIIENPKIKHLLRKEFENKKPDIVLFIRDMDGLEDDKVQLEKRKAYFTEFNSVVDKKGILLLNIYELEALLLSDVSCLVTYYKVDVEGIEDCMKVVDPKGYLKDRIDAYKTGHNFELFSMLDCETVISNCRYFKKFIVDLDKIINN